MLETSTSLYRIVVKEPYTLPVQLAILYSSVVSNLNLTLDNSFQNLETELNDLRPTVYNLNSILVELNNICDESITYELEQDIQELNRRYGSIAERVKHDKTQTEQMIADCQAFDKDCAEMLAWLRYQSDVLDQESDENEPPLLAAELAQLKECQVS